MAPSDDPLKPGRLGDPEMGPGTDPRSNPKFVAALAPYGMDKAIPAPEGGPQPGSAYDMSVLSAALDQNNAQFDTFYNILPNELPREATDPEVHKSEIKIPGPDGNEIILYVFKPKDNPSSDPLPCVVYIHGGGMTVLSTTNKVHMRWTQEMALAGAIGIAVDFRNAWTPQGYNHFPKGLNDCAAGVQYIYDHRQELGISKIILQGESGGGNLALATALKANREGWIGKIDGVYACVPYISGGYGRWSEERMRQELPSLVENNGYLLNVKGMGASAHAYTPKKEDQEDALAWPYFATEKDLQGLPPVTLSMDELDPLRSEGVALYRKMVAAGVEVTGQVNLGIPHAASLMFRKAMPEVHLKAIREIVAFARSL